MKILMVLTSHDRLGDTGRETGIWLEEFTTPYYVFRDAGAEVTLASPAGGKPPVDPASEQPDAHSDSTHRFLADHEAGDAFSATRRLADVDPQAFDAVFFPGGHGPMWDLASNVDAGRLVEGFYNSGKPVAAVCHGPAALLGARTTDGRPLIRGKRITGFSNAEEEQVGLADVVPFRLAEALADSGAHYQHGDPWAAYCVVDGRLITGQNPASSADVARALLDALA